MCVFSTRVWTTVWNACAVWTKPIGYQPATSTDSRTVRELVLTNVVRPPDRRTTAKEDTGLRAANRTSGRFWRGSSGR
jgi:hypothetical protein